MRQVAVVGAGMTRFGKYLETSMKDIGREAVDAALKSAGVEKSALDAAVVGNAMAGLVTGQECVRGQVVLREMGIQDIPIVNTENACASSSTAFHMAWLYVASGMYDMVLALGVEKLYHENKQVSFGAIASAVDVEQMQQIMAQMKAAQEKKQKQNGDAKAGGGGGGAGKSRSMFMDFYAAGARAHMEKYGTTQLHFAKVASKNHNNGSLNPHAQYRERYTPEEIISSPDVVFPLTRLMCSPIGDGAAATILCSEEKARQLTNKPVFIKASLLGSGMDRKPGDASVEERVAKRAYEMAGVTPQDLNVIELHDASSPAELTGYEELGLCGVGEGARLIDEGITEIGGKIPVNTSGGLLSKGHPVGATGVAQICEIFWQLRGEAADRQVEGAKLGLTQNGGGVVRGEAAAMAVHILST